MAILLHQTHALNVQLQVNVMRPVLAIVLIIPLASCDKLTSGKMSASERFQLEAKCADEAREFETAWRKDNGTDFETLFFRHHYNFPQGKCYSLVYFGHSELAFETVYDALSGTTKFPLVTVVTGDDRAANESSEHKKLQKQIAELMEDDNP
ncbi:MAG TPA: hypothetical protein VIY49_34025 [Bryobacteraceae bacterium]